MKTTPKFRIIALVTTVIVLLFVVFVAWAHHVADQARSLTGTVAAAIYTNHPVKAEEVLQHNPNDVNAHAGLAAAYVIKNDKVAAIREYRKVLELQPDNEDATMWLAHLLMSIGQQDEGRHMYQKLATKDDDYGKDARAMLKILSEQNQH